jgi:hypothetical protein
MTEIKWPRHLETGRHAMQDLRILLLLAAVASFSPAQAEDVPSSADIRCLMIGMRMSAVADPNQRTGGNMLAIYYFGRLEKFSPKQLEEAILKESLSVKPEDFLADSSRCGKILMEKGHVITQIGDDLVRRGQEAQQKKPAAPAVAPAVVPPPEDKQPHDK